MDRAEMLKALYDLPTAVELVILSDEMAIECTYISKNGFKYEWIALDEWPAITTFLNRQDFQRITTRIREDALQLNDIEGTSLCSMYIDLFAKEDTNLNSIFSNLAEISYPEDGTIYMLRTPDKLKFFSKYEHFEASFTRFYAANCTPWETLSDVDLKEWILRAKNEFDGIPCSSYGEQITQIQESSR